MTKTMSEVIEDTAHDRRIPLVDADASKIAAALSAAGFGLVTDAKREAWDEGWAHYQTYFSPSEPKFGANPYRAAVRGEG